MFKIIKFSDKLEELISQNAQLEKLTTGYVWSEGPIWDESTKSLYYTDFSQNEIYRWTEKDGVKVHRKNSASACGLAFDKENRILCAESITRSVTRIEKDGSITTVASHYNGKRLNSPNDIIVKSDGTIYFTDPHSKDTGNIKELDVNGVYKLSKAGNLTLLAQLNRPNGLAFSPDEKKLYVDDTNLQLIQVYDIKYDGTLENSRLFAKIDTSFGHGAADGLKLDCLGNVYVTGPGGISIFSPEGELLGLLKTPEIAANLCFGSDDMQTLYITAQSSVYRIHTEVKGLKNSSQAG
ncbi:MAG TPA: SMP-30/gluconolactonase/LRE family protein [Ruminiclostridium sp.]